MSFQTSYRMKASASHQKVNLLPLIDILFLLISFFLVTSIHMVNQQGIAVDLSPSESADPELSPAVATLSIDKSGRFFLNKDPYVETMLLSALQTISEKNPDIQIHIQADKESHHGALITALDLIRRVGLHNVVFSVEQKQAT